MGAMLDSKYDDGCVKSSPLYLWNRQEHSTGLHPAPSVPVPRANAARNVTLRIAETGVAPARRRGHRNLGQDGVELIGDNGVALVIGVNVLER